MELTISQATAHAALYALVAYRNQWAPLAGHAIPEIATVAAEVVSRSDAAIRELTEMQNRETPRTLERALQTWLGVPRERALMRVS